MSPLRPDDWEVAFDTAMSESHNDGRALVEDVLVEIVARRVRDVASLGEVREELSRSEAFLAHIDRAWPLLDPAGIVASLWSSPALLRRCAPWLSAAEVATLQRADARAWTLSDLPFLDAARRATGDPHRREIEHQRAISLAAQRAYRADIADYLRAFSDDDLGLLSMLRGEDAQNSLVDETDLPRIADDPLAGPFAHIVIDEAQELSDAEWRVLVSRCPSRSFTIVGDRAQARHGFTESWRERLQRIGVPEARVATLTVNYRTPEEVMREAKPVIRAALPDANGPVSVRRSGIPVRHGVTAEASALVFAWLTAHEDGVACVIGDPAFLAADRLRSLSPALAKGLEFDLVVLIEPDSFGDGITGAMDRYIAMTRTTGELVVLTPNGR